MIAFSGIPTTETEKWFLNEANMSETRSIIVPLTQSELIWEFEFGFNFVLTDLQSFVGSLVRTSVDSL